MKIISTPFDNIIVHFAEMSMRTPRQPNPFISLVQQQLSLLRLMYLEMHEVDFYKKTLERSKSQSNTLPFAVFALTTSQDTNKAIMDYQSFTFIINQFGRALSTKYKVDLAAFPKYYETRFYRNKVSEHWDEYVNVSNKGLTFQKGKSAIPVVGELFQPVKRAKVARELEATFDQIGIQTYIPEEFVQNSMVSTNVKYVQFMYDTLKKINKTLNFPQSTDVNDPHYKLITLLFDFGFPAPILDIEAYSKELVEYVVTIFDEHLTKNKS